MLRTVVWNRLAIFSRVSPVLIVYIRNVGAGVGVGRTKLGVGVGPAGVGTGVAAPGRSARGVARVAGSGTHAIVAAAAATVRARSVLLRLAMWALLTRAAQ